MIAARFALTGTLCILLSCAARTVISTQSQSQQRLAELSAEQNSALKTFAALYRVKLSRDGKIDDFRVELFSRGDSLLSLYVRGFLGKSVLKATLAHDSLTAYFPSQDAGYIGKRGDLEAGELKSAGETINFLVRLFHGGLVAPDTSEWSYYVREKGSRLDLDLINSQLASKMKTRFLTSNEHFPYIKLVELNLVSKDDRLRIHLETHDTDFNREIPDSKFEIEIPPGTDMVSKEDLADLLTGIS
jgi:hypothetical protein